MLAISELSLVSRVQAVAVPPLVVGLPASIIDSVATDAIKVNALSPTVFRNHSPAENAQTPLKPHEEQKVPARHIDRFA